MCEEKKHRLAARLGLEHRLAKRHLHQRIEAAGRLIENQQLGAARERGNQLHLLTVAMRKGPHLLVGVELKTLDEHVPVRPISASADAGKELQRLGARERRPQIGLRRHIGNTVVRNHRVAPSVDTKQLRPTAARTMQPEQEPDRRRLARAVRTQIAVHLTRLNPQIERVKSERLAVALRQPRRPNRQSRG